MERAQHMWGKWKKGLCILTSRLRFRQAKEQFRDVCGVVTPLLTVEVRNTQAAATSLRGTADWLHTCDTGLCDGGQRYTQRYVLESAYLPL